MVQEFSAVNKLPREMTTEELLEASTVVIKVLGYAAAGHGAAIDPKEAGQAGALAHELRKRLKAGK